MMRWLLVAVLALAPTTALADAPIRLAHYYPWYPEHCQTAPWTHYQPWLGCYNSSDQGTINLHIAWAQYAGLDGFISSWWGPGSPEDARLQTLLDSGFKWTVHYELEGYDNPSPARISQDLRYLRRYFRHPNWLKIAGKPVVFVYAGGGSPNTSSRWDVGRRLSGVPVFLAMEAYWGFENDPYTFDSWHTYGPGATGRGLEFVGNHAATVTPEYWYNLESQPRLPQNPDRFENDLRTVVNSGVPLQIITSWNEWHESTAVEPSSDWADPAVYLRAMCRQFKGVGC